MPAAHGAAESHLMQLAKAALVGSGMPFRAELQGRLVRDVQFVHFLIILVCHQKSECLLYCFSVLLTNFVTRMTNLNCNTCGLTTASTCRKDSHATHGRCMGERNEIEVPHCLCERLTFCGCFDFLISLHCCKMESET